MASIILVVDDEDMTRHLLRLMLEREGYIIHEALDGLDALAKIEQHQPQLVIMDVMMPHLDGFGACERIRANGKTTHLPVVLLSARVQQEAIAEGMRVGANCYLTKPISRPDLVQTVSNLLVTAPRTTN